jgi:hypothetical protein
MSFLSSHSVVLSRPRMLGKLLAPMHCVWTVLCCGVSQARFLVLGGSMRDRAPGASCRPSRSASTNRRRLVAMPWPTKLLIALVFAPLVSASTSVFTVSDRTFSAEETLVTGRPCREEAHVASREGGPSEV